MAADADIPIADSPVATPPERARAPRIWVVSGYRAGENTQVSALAERLGCAWVRKDLEFNSLAGPIGLARMVSRSGLESERSSILAPPWPDLVISAGLKNEPVCRWIKRQSGGRTRLVFLGRVWAPRSDFDLIVTTPQYRLPQLDNVLHNVCTQHPVTTERLATERGRWQAQFGQLPSPKIGVLVGGDSGPYALGQHAGRRLAAGINKLQQQIGGTVLVTSSARTRPVVMDVLEECLPEPRFTYRWRPRGRSNPFLGILAHADVLVVTCDSIAMLSEAAATGKPVYIFRMPVEGPEDGTLAIRLYRALMRWGPTKLSRDQSLCHRAIIEAGFASWLGDPEPVARHSPQDEIARTVERVRALIKLPDSAPGPSASPSRSPRPSTAGRPDPQSLPARIDAIPPGS